MSTLPPPDPGSLAGAAGQAAGAEGGAWQVPLSPGEPRSFSGGRYVVQRRLGAGNFATVYLAHDERLEVPVAVKLLSDRWSWEPEVRGRFVQEARLLRSLNDSHVVQIRDIAETEDGRPFIVMDFATEGTLEQRTLELVQRGVQPSAEDLRTAARALAGALAVLHERRIAHRDIKPSNLLITRSGPGAPAAGGVGTAVLRPGERLMLGDLGLAKDLAFDSGITVGVGTAGYMAPEQTLGGAKIDTRTDIFAASALLMQLASGEAPDPARRVSSGRMETGRPLPATIPGPLGAALLHGLDANPDARPQTIQQWLGEVEVGLGPVTNSTVPYMAAVSASSSAHGARPRLDGRRKLAVIAATGVIAVGGVAFALSSGGDGEGTPSADTTGTSRVVADNGFRVTLNGPTEIKLGVQAVWSIDAPGAVGGVWTLTGPVQPDPNTWTPGTFFAGTWNVQGTFELTLTATDGEGQSASHTILFTVVP